MDKESRGRKYICSNCAAKFFDLNREKPICPKCGKEQIPSEEKSIVLKNNIVEKEDKKIQEENLVDEEIDFEEDVENTIAEEVNIEEDDPIKD